MKTIHVPLLLLAAGAARAQDTNSTEVLAREVAGRMAPGLSPAELAERLNLAQILESGGILMYVLGAMSVVAFALILFYFFTLTGARVSPAQFVRDLGVMLKHSRFKEARAACVKNGSPAAALTLAALDYLERAEQADQDLLREVVEGEGIRQASRLQTQITYLMDIGVIAPMVGLLGTVMGMLKSFNSVALDIAKARPMELAAGVSQALITTAAGLVVAIPAMIFYAIFRGRVAKLTANLEWVATELVTTLVHRKSV